MRGASMREDAFLGARFFLIAPRPSDRRVEAVKIQRRGAWVFMTSVYSAEPWLNGPMPRVRPSWLT